MVQGGKQVLWEQSQGHKLVYLLNNISMNDLLAMKYPKIVLENREEEFMKSVENAEKTILEKYLKEQNIVIEKR